MSEAMEKSIHELKVEFVHLCVRERERERESQNNSFEITVTIFRACKKYRSSIQKEFLKGLLTSTSFFLYFRDRPKNGEGNKREVKSIYVHGSTLYSTCSKSTNSMKPYGKISTEWAKVLYLVWEKVLFSTEVKVFLL